MTCHDRAGQPYEITLNLARDSVPFASVGQRCGHELARLADQVTAARLDPEQAAAWPDPDDRFPSPAPPAAKPATGGAHHPGGYLPGESEYFWLRSRDRVDLPGSGELRCLLRSSAIWMGDCVGTGRHGPPGRRPWPAVRESAVGRDRWRLSRRAVIEAWGTGGIGVRAVLTSAELVAFLDTVLTGPDSFVPAGAEVGESAGKQTGGAAVPYWRQRGRVPDGIARSRLPAVRAQARGGADASGGPPPRRGDVRR